MGFTYTDREPDFINESGVKWWIEKSLTQWAQKEDRHGTSLPFTAFLLEFQDGAKTYVLVNDKQEVLADSTQYEAIACDIDVLKFLKRDREANPEKKPKKPKKPKKTKE